MVIKIGLERQGFDFRDPPTLQRVVPAGVRWFWQAGRWGRQANAAPMLQDMAPLWTLRSLTSGCAFTVQIWWRADWGRNVELRVDLPIARCVAPCREPTWLETLDD